MTRTRSRRGAVTAVLAIVAVVTAGVGYRVYLRPSARITTAIPWADRGVWLKADLHTQTKFSDGANTVSDMVANAARNGCDVVAITDHGDAELKAATPEYVAAIRTARTEAPDTLVVTGLEWNVPPGKGDEHAIVLFPTAMEDLDTLVRFKNRYDDWKKVGEDAPLALEGLASLAPESPDALGPVVAINHPNRRPDSASAPAVTFEALKRSAPYTLIGLEGAPGHQKGVPLGAYDRRVKPIDRWDPVAAEVGGKWDQWLGADLNVWAALANSDFHNANGDFWPCEFARTWIYAPDRTVDGVLRALHAGSFFAEHGHIVNAADLRAALADLPRPAQPGETVAARAGAVATITLHLDVSPQDYLGEPSRIDNVELIGVTAADARVLFTGAPAADGDAFTVPVTIPPGGIVLRARGRRNIDGGPALMFYTNPIRITAPSP